VFTASKLTFFLRFNIMALSHMLQHRRAVPASRCVALCVLVIISFLKNIACAHYFKIGGLIQRFWNVSRHRCECPFHLDERRKRFLDPPPHELVFLLWPKRRQHGDVRRPKVTLIALC
jgi:hypothetical protein